MTEHIVQLNSRRQLVVGNWKMNGDKTLVEQMQRQFAAASLDNVDVVICPPLLYLGLFDGKVKLGSQNMSQFDSGAHTGEVSVAMLNEFNCQYVIIGHSERRADNNESDALVALKVEQALKAHLTPILCVGEPENVREDGTLFDYIAAQLDAALLKICISQFSDVVLAVIKHGYENSTMITEASSKKGLFLAIMYILCSASLKTFMDGKLSALD